MRLCSSLASGVATAVAVALALTLACALAGAPAAARASTVTGAPGTEALTLAGAPAAATASTVTRGPGTEASTVTRGPGTEASTVEGTSTPAARQGPAPLVAYEPSCAPADRADFPVDARIHEGPRTYRPGGGRQEWAIGLTNATSETCDRVHPLVVLVGKERSLRPEHIGLEFHDGSRWHPVAFHRTDQSEIIGVFDDGFGGFSVGPGKTVTVKVRMGFTGEAAADTVTATAALVQRRKNDGDWVGESNPYAFGIAPDAPAMLSADQLARTGERYLTGLGATAALLVIGGAALIAFSRRYRDRTPGAPR
ncbi:hypothetical protein [Streptomyces flavofungini]|uniref:hypothetical protein n=1 Tax=Streptomyces flavofungini TaxID=68200 RepID=UPI0034DF698B